MQLRGRKCPEYKKYTEEKVCISESREPEPESDVPTSPSLSKPHPPNTSRSLLIRAIRKQRPTARLHDHKKSKKNLRECKDRGTAFHQSTIDSLFTPEIFGNISSSDKGYKYLQLTDKDNIVKQTHLLYAEHSIQCFSNPMIKNLQMKEFIVDNDWETDEEQITASIKYIEKGLKEGLTEFEKNPRKVHNYIKYIHKNELPESCNQVYEEIDLF